VERRALPNVYAEHLALAFRRRVGRLEGERDQQEEPFFTAVIPEPGSPDAGSSLKQGHMAIPAEVADVDPSLKRQEAHLLAGSEQSNRGPDCR
jgi:hypothetical protein